MINDTIKSSITANQGGVNEETRPKSAVSTTLGLRRIHLQYWSSHKVV